MNGWGVAADALVVAHLGFVCFAVLGGWAVLHRPRLAFLHLPVVAWAVWIEISGGVCPLTPLENAWRLRAGEAGYEGGFVEHYLLAILYPEGLTAAAQIVLGLGVLVINLAFYGALCRRLWLRRRRAMAE
ncbi:MAG TPA: DUF2784 domain-containing protein [Pseudomonadales bacterium]|nr:DUF2784 domain-containing protein [Pseudomonadales bacterium]